MPLCQLLGLSLVLLGMAARVYGSHGHFYHQEKPLDFTPSVPTPSQLHSVELSDKQRRVIEKFQSGGYVPVRQRNAGHESPDMESTKSKTIPPNFASVESALPDSSIRQLSNDASAGEEPIDLKKYQNEQAKKQKQFIEETEKRALEEEVLREEKEAQKREQSIKLFGAGAQIADAKSHRNKIKAEKRELLEAEHVNAVRHAEELRLERKRKQKEYDAMIHWQKPQKQTAKEDLPLEPYLLPKNIQKPWNKLEKFLVKRTLLMGIVLTSTFIGIMVVYSMVTAQAKKKNILVTLHNSETI